MISRAGRPSSVAELFSALGANVVIADVDESLAISAAMSLMASARAGNSVIGISADVSRESDVVRLFDQTLQRFRRLDISIHSAGIYPVDPFDDLSSQAWDRVLDVNLKGVFLCVREAGKRMKALGRGGSIINISSIGSILTTIPMAHYGAAKAGVNHVTRTAALRYAAHGIRVNAVLPGFISTERGQATAA